MKKVTLFLPTFLDGGVEKLFLTIAESLKIANYSVDFLLPGPIDNTYINNIDSYNFSDLGILKSHGDGRVILSLFKLVHYLKNTNTNYIFAAPGYSTIIVILAKLIAKSNTKVILVVDIKLSTFYKSKKIYQKILPFLARFLYPKSDHIIVSYNQIKKEFRKLYDIDDKKVSVIYPPLIQKDISTKSKENVLESWFIENHYKVILGVGRLVKEKDFVTLIKAFRILHKSQKNLKLVILGQGVEENNLKRLVENEGLNEDVAFYGFQTNPYKYIKRSSVLVVSSEWEAFGFTIIEALALGTQVVVTDVESEGPQEIVGFGKYGYISKVGSPQALSECIMKAINNPINIDILTQGSKDFYFNENSEKYAKVLNEL